MRDDRKSFAPLLVAIALLLLPALYVVSYLALVVPSGVPYIKAYSPSGYAVVLSYYRVGREWPGRIFWPLERLDRKLRPGVWRQELEVDP